MSDLFEHQTYVLSWQRGGDECEADLYVFDWSSLDADDKQMIDSCFMGYDFGGPLGERMTPIGILTEFEAVEEEFGEIDLAAVSGVQNDGLLLRDATGKIHCADDGAIQPFADSQDALQLERAEL